MKTFRFRVIVTDGSPVDEVNVREAGVLVAGCGGRIRLSQKSRLNDCTQCYKDSLMEKEIYQELLLQLLYHEKSQEVH